MVRWTISFALIARTEPHPAHATKSLARSLTLSEAGIHASSNGSDAGLAFDSDGQALI